MKSKIILTLFAFFLSFTIVSAQDKKQIMVTNHAAIIDALTIVKSSCEATRAMSTGWPDSVKNKMGLLYITAKSSSDRLIADYEIIIPDWRYAQRHNIDVKPQLEALQNANNAMVNYFNLSYLKYGNKIAGLAITTELIDMVFETVTKAYNFVKGISDAQKALYKQQVEDQRILYQYNGVEDPTPIVPAASPTKEDGTSKTDKGSSDNKKTPKPKTN